MRLPQNSSPDGDGKGWLEQRGKHALQGPLERGVALDVLFVPLLVMRLCRRPNFRICHANHMVRALHDTPRECRLVLGICWLVTSVQSSLDDHGYTGFAMLSSKRQLGYMTPTHQMHCCWLLAGKLKSGGKASGNPAAELLQRCLRSAQRSRQNPQVIDPRHPHRDEALLSCMVMASQAQRLPL